MRRLASIALAVPLIWAFPAMAEEADTTSAVQAAAATPGLIETSYQLSLDQGSSSTAARLLSGVGSSAEASGTPSLDIEDRLKLQPHLALDGAGGGLANGAYGPADPRLAADMPDDSRYRTFGSQFHRIRWEFGAVLLYYTGVNGSKLWKDPVAPHFHQEGYFGRHTLDQGVDKLAHAYSSYVLSELFFARLKHKTDDAPGIQFTAAALGFATMLYTELYDSIEPTAGWSWEDVSFNSLGAGFSILRNSVPGLDKKLDYRLMIMPVNGSYKLEGKEHFEAQRYFFALKLGGFHAFENGPLRFLELHVGYHAQDFTNADRAAGIPAKRKLFVGMGINLRELFFKDSTGWAGKAAGEVLDYFQPPYTTVHADLTN